MRDARLKTGKSLEECAQAMGISIDELTAIEYGERPPTLPEIEILAYYLEIPLDHFWGNAVLEGEDRAESFDAGEIKQIRQTAIGSLIRKARLEASLSPDELAQRLGITPDVLESYEVGVVAIPMPELEIIAQVLNSSITKYEDQESTVGSWFTEQRNMREFLTLPKELQEFVGKRINRPYLDLAIKLSELKVERLRALAEGLLEITY